MKETSKEYAQALFMIAKEKDMVDCYSDVLKEIGSLVEENAEYTEFLSDNNRLRCFICY